jgi:hypothetical protein
MELLFDLNLIEEAALVTVSEEDPIRLLAGEEGIYRVRNIETAMAARLLVPRADKGTMQGGIEDQMRGGVEGD